MTTTKKEHTEIGIYQTTCKLCGEKIVGITKEKAKENIVKHVDNDCVTAKQMKEWQDKGIYRDMMKMLRLQGLDDELKKLLKKLLKYYTKEEVEKALYRVKGEL